MKDIFRRLLDKCGVGGCQCGCCSMTDAKRSSARRRNKIKVKKQVRARIKEIDRRDLAESESN